MTTLKVTDKTGKVHTVQYTQNLRYADFMRTNGFTLDMMNTASELYNLCKQEWTKLVVSNTKSAMMESAKTRAVLKGKELKFRRTVTYAPAHATGSADELDAANAWLQRKVDASLKAQGIVTEFIASFDAKDEVKKVA